MWMLSCIVLALLFICSPVFRCMVFHAISTVVYTAADFAVWLSRAGWRCCKTGEIVAFCGLFGKGKTLSAVHRVTRLYKRYNGKKVYDKYRKKWVVQRVRIISNVELSVPYEAFTSMQQIVDAAKRRESIDGLCGTLTLTFVLGDEFSVQLNSRNFKNNMNPLLLNTVLTCRHHYISLFYTAQRFGHVDALLRQVTSYVVDCDKLWRFQRNYFYDAWELENATNVMLLKPFRRECWFVRNADYRAYNTLACVGNLVKDCEEGGMLTEEEILALQGYETVGVDGIVKPSRKLKKARKAGA